MQPAPRAVHIPQLPEGAATPEMALALARTALRGAAQDAARARLMLATLGPVSDFALWLAAADAAAMWARAEGEAQRGAEAEAGATEPLVGDGAMAASVLRALAVCLRGGDAAVQPPPLLAHPSPAACLAVATAAPHIGLARLVPVALKLNSGALLLQATAASHPALQPALLRALLGALQTQLWLEADAGSAREPPLEGSVALEALYALAALSRSLATRVRDGVAELRVSATALPLPPHALSSSSCGLVLRLSMLLGDALATVAAVFERPLMLHGAPDVTQQPVQSAASSVLFPAAAAAASSSSSTAAAAATSAGSRATLLALPLTISQLLVTPSGPLALACAVAFLPSPPPPLRSPPRLPVHWAGKPAPTLHPSDAATAMAEFVSEIRLANPRDALQAALRLRLVCGLSLVSRVELGRNEISLALAAARTYAAVAAVKDAGMACLLCVSASRGAPSRNEIATNATSFLSSHGALYLAACVLACDEAAILACLVRVARVAVPPGALTSDAIRAFRNPLSGPLPLPAAARSLLALLCKPGTGDDCAQAAEALAALLRAELPTLNLSDFGLLADAAAAAVGWAASQWPPRPSAWPLVEGLGALCAVTRVRATMLGLAHDATQLLAARSLWPRLAPAQADEARALAAALFALAYDDGLRREAERVAEMYRACVASKQHSSSQRSATWRALHILGFGSSIALRLPLPRLARVVRCEAAALGAAGVSAQGLLAEAMDGDDADADAEAWGDKREEEEGEGADGEEDDENEAGQEEEEEKKKQQQEEQKEIARCLAALKHRPFPLTPSWARGPLCTLLARCAQRPPPLRAERAVAERWQAIAAHYGVAALGVGLAALRAAHGTVSQASAPGSDGAEDDAEAVKAAIQEPFALAANASPQLLVRSLPALALLLSCLRLAFAHARRHFAMRRQLARRLSSLWPNQRPQQVVWRASQMVLSSAQRVLQAAAADVETAIDCAEVRALLTLCERLWPLPSHALDAMSRALNARFIAQPQQLAHAHAHGFDTRLVGPLVARVPSLHAALPTLRAQVADDCAAAAQSPEEGGARLLFSLTLLAHLSAKYPLESNLACAEALLRWLCHARVRPTARWWCSAAPQLELLARALPPLAPLAAKTLASACEPMGAAGGPRSALLRELKPALERLQALSAQDGASPPPPPPPPPPPQHPPAPPPM